MCGLVGVIGREPLAQADIEDVFGPMSRALTHRGPDGEGAWLAPSRRCALAHRRLAIIDLTPTGAQPMLSTDGRYTLVFNGEIYNYQELRRTLEAEGARFRGVSDTEVLLEALIRWGHEAALAALVGMFVFALWDERERRLLLGRDRAGEKPLFFMHANRCLVFASEIKALRAMRLTRWTLDRTALSHYLSLGFVPRPHTIWQGVRALASGCFAVVDSALEVIERPYWRYPPAKPDHGRSPESLVDECEVALGQAVRLRLRADVPIGVFLSGGIDSGLITALAAQATTRVNTFTIGFDDGSADETGPAAEVAARYGTNHHVLHLTPDLGALFESAGPTFDEPMADPAALLTFAIARETRRHVPVVLNGEGGDEVFGGYRRHHAAWWAGSFPLSHPFVSGFARSIGSSLPQPGRFRSRYAYFHRLVRGLGAGLAERALLWSADSFTDGDKRAMPGGGTLPDTEALVAQRLSPYAGTDLVRQIMALDFTMAMSDGLLSRLDLATMAHGLEGRCIFTDHHLIELAARLPSRALFAGSRTKAVLRKVASRYLPPGIVTAPKRGFELPLIAWLRGPAREALQDLCLA
ncbi:MAG: asparagine synthase (glutamine-hydrolyzing), partial [Rhodospirillaceae bacterium]